jgi:ABC-type multidrug transport system fused ATPase/permease subunit
MRESVVQEKQERILLLERQIARLRRRIDKLDARSNFYSWLRVCIFFGGLLVSVIIAMLTHWWVGVILFLCILVAFGIVAWFHSQIDGSLAWHSLWLHIRIAHVARMRLNWDSIPVGYEDAPREEHPFETDLDVTGKRSLHRLLNLAVSREGSQRLASWLLAKSPDPETIQRRQALVREMQPLSLFRDRLLLNSLQARSGLKEQLEGRRLLLWLEKQSPSSRWLLPVLLLSAVLNALTIVLFALTLFAGFPQFWVGSLVAGLLLFFGTGDLRGDILNDAIYLRYGFGALSHIFRFLEKFRYGKHEHLKQVCAPFLPKDGVGPTALMMGADHIIWAASLKGNALLWLMLNAVLPWDIYCASRLSQYKKRVKTRLPQWLDAWFELEALNSLATFAYLNPEYTLPEIVPTQQENQPQGSPIHFTARALGHPLLPVDKKISNDFSLHHTGEVIIITGSNMAGKSTFLRTLGANLCLAYAGAPVNAAFLETSLFRLFTCIRVSDSVTDGYSYFYAEVRRLRAMLEELARPGYPLFFLIDEIFKGTNNRERLIGSRSFVRALVGRNCTGAISTHDLELVKLAEQVKGIENYHFREDVIEGNMVFDYVLRPGPSPTTNALKIMALEGLPVEEGSLYESPGSRSSIAEERDAN